MAPPDRRIPSKPPVGLIVSAILLAVGIIGVIIFATWHSGTEILDARMRGTVVKKEFIPQPEEQITIGADGLSAKTKAGEYLLTVEVPQKDGAKKEYNVWLDKERYDAINIGDSFDVGPYLVPGGN